MPASELSLGITTAYRERWESIKTAAQGLARVGWGRLDPANLDASYSAWQTTMAATVRAAQAQAVSASNGYLSAYLASELEKEVEAARSPLGDYVGLSRDGRPLTDALASPLIAVKVALKAGKDLSTALREGQTRALRTIGLEVDHAARQSLQSALVVDRHVEGYRRAVRGTCGACLGAASRSFDAHVHFPVHPGCACVTTPIVRGVPDLFPVPTGAQLFAAMSEREQNEALGPEAAELVRAGAISLEELVGTSPQKITPDFITQRPVSALN